MDLLQQIVARAKADKQRIVLPEAEEERTLKAADKVLADDLADIILIGNPANIKNLAAQWGLNNIDKATIVDPQNNPKTEEYAEKLAELRKKKMKLAAKKNNVVAVTTPNLTFKIDRSTGLISEYAYNGKSLLGEGGTLKPNFWRAPTDNDMGAGLQKKFQAWKNPQMNLKNIDVKKDKKTNSVTILTSFDMPEVQGQMDITYVVFANTGAVKVTEDFKATEGAQVSDMFRFGMLMQMPYTMEKSNYYGRGPIENYSDRKDCMRIGVYTDDADNQYFPYIRPQESGTKSDIRWWKQTDATGLGLQVKSCTPFYASAIHFDTEELDDGDDKEQRHSFDLKKSKFTNLFLDSAHMGVGGENSWGAWPLEKYRVHYGNKTFTFTLIPQGK